MGEIHPNVLESSGEADGHYKGSDSRPAMSAEDETPARSLARSRWSQDWAPGLFSDEDVLRGHRSIEILVFFLTKVQSSSTWTWESLRSRRSMSLTCSQCKAATASHLRGVSSLVPRTREVPRRPRPSAKRWSPVRTFFLGVRRLKKVVPLRLEKAFPQVRHRKSRALPVLRVR